MKSPMIIALYIAFLLPGCAILSSSSDKKAYLSKITFIAENMVQVMQSHLPDLSGHIFVQGEESGVLASALKKAGYSIEENSDSAHVLMDWSSHKLAKNPDWQQATITINKDHTLSRSYKFLHNRFISATDLTFSSKNKKKFIQGFIPKKTLNFSKEKYPNKIEPGTLSESSLLNPGERPAEDTEVSTSKNCSEMTILQGSIYASVTRLVNKCGYNMGHWNFIQGERVNDWLVPATYSFVSGTGIFGLLDLLASNYGIQGLPNRLDKTIDFGPVQ